MAQYLSKQWFDEMQAAAAAFSGDATGSVSLREIVTEAPVGDVSYVLILQDGQAQFSFDPEADADVTFTQTYDTAVGLHKGDLTIHEAFFAGRVRVAGHLNTLLEHSDSLQGLSPAFEAVRAATTY